MAQPRICRLTFVMTRCPLEAAVVEFMQHLGAKMDAASRQSMLSWRQAAATFPQKRVRVVVWNQTVWTLFFFDRKKGLLGNGSCQRCPFLKSLEILETVESPQSVENKGASDHFVEILEKVKILEIPPAKRPLSNDPFPGPDSFMFSDQNLI